TCETVCPVGAITFPSKEMIQRIEKEYAMLRYVQAKKEKKGTKLALSKARDKAEKLYPNLLTTQISQLQDIY
ncbi:MAG: hypothetical protein DRI33_00790, partial [Caldiserica bacterium]